MACGFLATPYRGATLVKNNVYLLREKKKSCESYCLSNLSKSSSPSSPSPSPGMYRNGETAIEVREARLEDCWQVAETHCSSFFPDYTFPMNLALRLDRLLGLLSGFSLPIGCHRTCLVALLPNHHLPLEPPQYVAGILTVDTVADFLPRKGPLRHRRSGIAYVSNVAVGKRDRCKGIGKRLMAMAEDQARAWGCRAIALHCDMNNPAAARLYKGRGFKCIKVPHTANWPQPKTAPNVQFTFMMKLLTTTL